MSPGDLVFATKASGNIGDVQDTFTIQPCQLGSHKTLSPSKEWELTNRLHHLEPELTTSKYDVGLEVLPIGTCCTRSSLEIPNSVGQPFDDHLKASKYHPRYEREGWKVCQLRTSVLLEGYVVYWYLASHSTNLHVGFYIADL